MILKFNRIVKLKNQPKIIKRIFSNKNNLKSIDKQDAEKINLNQSKKSENVDLNAVTLENNLNDLMGNTLNDKSSKFDNYQKLDSSLKNLLIILRRLIYQFE